MDLKIWNVFKFLHQFHDYESEMEVAIIKLYTEISTLSAWYEALDTI